MKISEIDKNFAIEESIGDDICWFDAEESPFKIYGLIKEDGIFRRMPQAVADTVNRKVSLLNTHAAGGRVRFKTDSTRIAILAKMPTVGKMPHFAYVGSAGFDLYEETEEDNVYRSSYKPSVDMEGGFSASVTVASEREMRSFTINFPSYSTVEKLFIGLDDGAIIEAPTPYMNSLPVVYYGSSITQGACSSKPGDTYQNFISRRFNLDYTNLGFSGSAVAEETITNYIKGLDMSIFVYDYDHNSPRPSHLKETHEKMFLAIRNAHPDLPIIMMTRPRYTITEDTRARLEIIEETYNNAIARGDKNVYLLRGYEMTAPIKNNGLVDGVHPTSLGFWFMSEAIGGVIEEIIAKGAKFN